MASTVAKQVREHWGEEPPYFLCLALHPSLAPVKLPVQPHPLQVPHPSLRGEARQHRTWNFFEGQILLEIHI
jgi:hypothetical protein